LDFNTALAILGVWIRGLITLLQPVIIPICFVSAWGLSLLCIWSAWSAFRKGVVQAKVMHTIPCANCQFFSEDYRLKCSVHPQEALTEQAIGCSDYSVRTESLIPHRLIPD